MAGNKGEDKVISVDTWVEEMRESSKIMVDMIREEMKNKNNRSQEFKMLGNFDLMFDEVGNSQNEQETKSGLKKICDFVKAGVPKRVSEFIDNIIDFTKKIVKAVDDKFREVSGDLIIKALKGLIKAEKNLREKKKRQEALAK